MVSAFALFILCRTFGLILEPTLIDLCPLRVKSGETAIAQASRRGHKEIVALLTTKGARLVSLTDRFDIEGAVSHTSSVTSDANNDDDDHDCNGDDRIP
jgi:hypothetical protein